MGADFLLQNPGLWESFAIRTALMVMDDQGRFFMEKSFEIYLVSGYNVFPPATHFRGSAVKKYINFGGLKK